MLFLPVSDCELKRGGWGAEILQSKKRPKKDKEDN